MAKESNKERALTLEAIRVLDAIDRRGSFAAAADELGKVPSALSYTVQKLEDELDAMLFDRSGHRTKFTPAGRMLLEQGRLLLEAAEHLSFCDYCLLRYTAMIDAAPDCMKQPMRDLIPQVQSLMRLRSFRIMTNRYVSAAAAVVLGFVMWGAVSTFGVPNAAALLPQQPAARPERFGTKFNTAVNGFYKSLDDTFKSFTLTAENGLDQIRAQSIGGSTAKGE